jgi:hypothetical protein
MMCACLGFQQGRKRNLLHLHALSLELHDISARHVLAGHCAAVVSVEYNR